MNPPFRRIKNSDERCSHESQDQSLKDKHGEHFLGENAGGEPDVKHDQFNKTEKRMSVAKNDEGYWRAYPLQLINDPTALDSRQLMPKIREVSVQAVNFPAKSRHII